MEYLDDIEWMADDDDEYDLEIATCGECHASWLLEPGEEPEQCPACKCIFD